ncbi:MAG TPA: hypothetical protein PK514_11325 [Spirochaetota bacterium]|nr:hypothetical protein [Spirochaetota bacterium]
MIRLIKKILITLTFVFCCSAPSYSEGAVAGFTLGTPGLVNLNLGYYGDTFGIQGSISMLHLADVWLSGETDDTSSDIEEDSGLFYALFQLNLDCILFERGDIMLAGSVAGGTICFSDEGSPESDLTLFYVGPCVHAVFYNFYLELGAAYGKDFSARYEEKNTHIIPLVQLGYMKYF